MSTKLKAELVKTSGILSPLAIRLMDRNTGFHITGIPLDTRRELRVHNAFRKHLEHLPNV